ncbi:unnamed protein product [Chironomus riparius]|uniref:F-box domain-containing protein n=1 Tax=Chironomus riparius TaxID=315576 RepID=A0A9N9RTL7_9DIPT|nr:unnamed protein product [Chironomus riparius]
MEIKSLPNELQEEIFTYLNCNELMAMMLVDKYTKSIIESSPILMSNLPILIIDEDEFYDDNERSIEPILESTRRATKIVIKLKRDKIMKYLVIFKKFSDTVRELEIHDYGFETIDQMRIVLRHLYNLKRLTVINVTFLKPENEFLNSIVQVPKLSMLELREINCVNTDEKMFALFANNYDIQLRKIRLKCDGRNTSNCLDFCEMMTQQAYVKSLTFENVTSKNCNIFNYENFLQCQLRHLEIVNCQLSREHMKVMLNMIKNQQNLETIKVINTPIPSSLDIIFVYRQMFSNPIKEVHVDINDLSFFHSHSFTNRSIRNLTIHGNFAFENLPIFINFIKIFPNVEHLKLVGDMPISDKYLFHILSTFSNLEELSIPGFTSRTIDSNFSNLSCLDVKLKTLILDYIDYDVKFFGWKNIVSNVNSIEKLIIKRDYCNVSNEIVDIIIKKLKLKHLELGCGVVSEDILRNIVYNNCADELRVLKITQSDFDKIKCIFDFNKLFKSNRLLLSLCNDGYFVK